MALCKPLSAQGMLEYPTGVGDEMVPTTQLMEQWRAGGQAIVLEEQPLVIGLPPGLGGAVQCAGFDGKLASVHRDLLGATRLTNSKTEEVHDKLVSIANKIKVFTECQRQQDRLDRDYREVELSCYPLLKALTGSAPLGIKGGGEMEHRRMRSDHSKATPEAATLVYEYTQGKGSLLLCPGSNGDWAKALHVAKSKKLLREDFPDLSRHPLSKIAAIQIQASASRRRQGLRKITEHVGSVRAITATELEFLDAVNATPEARPENEDGLELWLTAGSGFADMGWEPGTTFEYEPQDIVLCADLIEIDVAQLGSFYQALDDFMSKVRWHSMKLKAYGLRREKYSCRPLRYGFSVYETWCFSKLFLETVAVNILEQLPQASGAGKSSQDRMLQDAKDQLNALVEAPGPILDQASRAAFEEEMEEEQREDEKERYEYLSIHAELGSDVLHPPRYNPDITGGGDQPVEQGAGGERPQPSVHREGAQNAQPNVQGRSAPSGGGFNQPRSRASSGDSSNGGGQERGGENPRFSPPPPSTASQWRGDDRTHSLALQLQRARQQLNSMVADPDSTKYKEQRKNVREMLRNATKHLTDDQDISQSYEEFLVDEMNQTEIDCASKDDEMDLAERRKKKVEDDKKDLLATLPRGLGTKFSGTAAEYPGVRQYFVDINQSVNGPLAVSHMIALIDTKTKEGSRLAKRLKIYKNGDELIADLDKDFGHSFLNCQHILNKMNQLKKATSEDEEMDTIVQFRQAKRALDLNEDNEKLLNVPQLIQWADLLLPTTCKELMTIIQNKGFGEEESPTEKYFDHLEEVYERNSVLIRNREARMPLQKEKPAGQGRRPWGEAHSRTYGVQERPEDPGEGCGAFCKTGHRHLPWNCPVLKQGKVSLKMVKQTGLCTCCVGEKQVCKKGKLQGKDGKVVYFTCRQCKHHKAINCHQKCKNPQRGAGGGASGGRAGTGGSGGVTNGPPVPLEDGAPVQATVEQLRTEATVLVNPGLLGAALEIVDYAVLIAPDKSTLRVRTIYDNGGSDCMISWKMERFFHHRTGVTVGVNGANGTRRFKSEIGELQVLNADGAVFCLKALKSDLSGKAFTIKRKFADVPPRLHHHFVPGYQEVNEIGDVRHWNLTEGATDQVDLVIGLDAVALFPREIDRDQDEHGQLVMWRSLISNQVLVSGSRKSGWASPVYTQTVDHRSYVVLEEGDQPVTLLRTAVDLGIEDSRNLFERRKNLTKVERKLYTHFEDNDQLVPPQPEQCPSCQGCEICKDPFKARRNQTVNKLMDQLVSFKEGSREQGGGFHIKLIYDPELLAKVSEGRQAALRRLLSTEKQLLRPEMKGALQNFNKKMKQCQEKGYFVSPEEVDLTGLQKSYQPVSFALKDEEKLGEEDQLPGVPGHKMKARPVIDSSSCTEGGVSVNAAQYKIPDVHTLKISQILLQLRTAKHFAIGDISEYYYRMWCDRATSSLTRILFRKGGLGSGGQIVELVPKVASMGMKEISTFAAHVRYRVSQTIKDEDPRAAEQLKGSYCDDVTLFQGFDEDEDGEQCVHRGPGSLLVSRARLVEEALNHAHLHLGDKWITDVSQEVCGDTMVGVAAGSERSVNLGSSCHTSALGYRLHLGGDHPPGGSLLWKVHRPQTLNLEPKKRGARPEWAQLATTADIRGYLKNQGVSKAGLLSLTSSLFDPLLLAAVFISTARQLFRRILREVELTSWKAKVPERYHGLIADLAEDLLEVSKKLKLPRLAVIPNPLLGEAKAHPCGYLTLLIIHDGSAEAGVAAAFVHQMFPFESGSWASDADFSGVTVSCRLLCAAVKLTDNKGNNCQISGELLSKFIACRLKDTIVDNAMVKFDQVRICGDSLTVEKAIRKTDAAFNLWAGKRIASIQRSIDIDCSYHVPHSVTDSIVDAATKYQRKPSRFLNEKWFRGEGILDVPIQKLPYSDRAVYAFPKIQDLPSQWLSSAAKTFLGLNLPAVIIMRADVEGEQPEMSLLEQLADKYRDVEKAISVLQYILRMRKQIRDLPTPEQRRLCLDMFVSEDYDKIQAQMKGARVTKQLIVDQDDEKGIITMRGRFGYSAKMLANPKTSPFSRLVLKNAHDKQHLTNSARIMARLGRSYLFTGGALGYLNKLRAECQLCKLLKPQVVRTLMGDPPEPMRGPLPESVSTWRHQSIDLFGPWVLAAFPRSKQTRGSNKKLKVYGLVMFDYSSRAVEAEICEAYTTDSVILALKACWSRVGKPQYLNFDAAANLAAAGDILGGGDDLQPPSIGEGDQLQRELTQQLSGVGIQIRPRVPLAPHRQVSERAVQFCKRELRQMLKENAGGLLTPLQASSILSCAIAHINERPLIVHGSPDEVGVLTPWFLSHRNMSVSHSQIVDSGGQLENPLSRRAFQAQQRLDMFKGLFDVFYHRQLVRFGKWNTQGRQPRVGDTCLILDKQRPKVNFISRFQLGRVKSFTSKHVCEIAFVKQTPQVTAALVKDLKNGSPDWRKKYQVQTSTCTRDVRQLSIITSSQERELERGVDIDMFVDQVGPGAPGEGTGQLQQDESRHSSADDRHDDGPDPEEAAGEDVDQSPQGERGDSPAGSHHGDGDGPVRGGVDPEEAAGEEVDRSRQGETGDSPAGGHHGDGDGSVQGGVDLREAAGETVGHLTDDQDHGAHAHEERGSEHRDEIPRRKPVRERWFLQE